MSITQAIAWVIDIKPLLYLVVWRDLVVVDDIFGEVAEDGHGHGTFRRAFRRLRGRGGRRARRCENGREEERGGEGAEGANANGWSWCHIEEGVYATAAVRLRSHSLGSRPPVSGTLHA